MRVSQFQPGTIFRHGNRWYRVGRAGNRIRATAKEIEQAKAVIMAKGTEQQKADLQNG